MTELIEIRAVLRVERLARVLHALERRDISHITVTKVHGTGAAVDPSETRLSLGEEGGRYMDMAMVQLVCTADQKDEYVELVSGAARTGRRGDGIISIYRLLDAVKIRTAQRGTEALQ